jgi:hypothetical protein
MEFVVYHIASTRAIKSFDCQSSAKRSATCMNRNAGSMQYGYISRDSYYSEIVKKITVKSLGNGQDVEIDSNTPWHCRPDSESYWSM